MAAVKIGLLGLGTVGAGTLRLLRRSAAEIERRTGRRLEVVWAAVRNPAKDRGDDLKGIAITDDPWQVVRDPDIQIVVELMGGDQPAYDLIMEAIALGKHVVTANKALIAKHGNEIFAAAERQGVAVAFEAAVAGGIPIIKAIRESLAGNRIEWLAGIINGTSNYILTEMRSRGLDFQTALAQAQQLGYAEADPTFDIEGIDAAHKLTILASIAFGIPLQFDKVYIEGISGITREDIDYAWELGFAIKHLGIAQSHAHGVALRVHPTLVPLSRLIANVNGVMNAVLVHGDAVGDSLYYGAGAGANPTASAVVADLVDMVRLLTADPGHRVPYLGFKPQGMADLPILPITAIETSYYLRLSVRHHPGVMAEITRILADESISIEAIMQKPAVEDQPTVTVILLTHEVLERRMNEALAKIARLPTVAGPVVRIRLENFGD